MYDGSMSKPTKTAEGTWRIRYLDANGKRVSATFDTQALARTELRRLETDADETKIRRQRYGAEALTVAEAWLAFQVNRKPDPNNTERRFKARGGSMRRCYSMHIEPHLADRALVDLTPKVLREWIGKLKSTPTKRPGEKNVSGTTLSASTIRAVVTTLRQVAKSNDVVLTVLLGDELRQKQRRTRPRALQSVDDIRALVAACPDPWFKVAAALACYSGARLGEIASLRWRDIGDETIQLVLSWEGPLKHRYEDDEDDGARTVPLSPELAAILADWRAVTHGGADDRVVLVQGKRPLREGHDDVAAKTRAACKRAGLTPLTFHSLRASFATVTADLGLPITKLSALMGHSSAQTTAIYTRTESGHAALDPRARLGAPKEPDAPPVLN